MRISDWSSDVCSSDLAVLFHCFAGCTADAIMSASRTGKILAPANHDPGQRQDSKTDLNKLALAVWRHAEPFAGTLADRYLREGRSIVPDRKSTRPNYSPYFAYRMPSSA